MASFKKCFGVASLVSKSCCRSQILSQRLPVAYNAIRHYGKTYEGDGKTYASVLNDEGLGLMINSYSEIGFTLNNGVSVLGPIAIFPNCVLSWNVGDVSQINEETLSLFLLLEPKLDILILGVSDLNKNSRKTVSALANLVRKHRIQVEVMSTEIACPTFNFLHAEHRFVGAGIIPPRHVSSDESMAIHHKGTLGYAPFSSK